MRSGDVNGADWNERDEVVEESVVSTWWCGAGMDRSASLWLEGEVRWAIRSGDCMSACMPAVAAAVECGCSLCALVCCAALPFACCSAERRCASCCR